MSSTSRGAQRHDDDYYVTPHWLIEELLDAVEHDFLGQALKSENVLDPSCGGCNKYEPSYPTVLKKRFPNIQLMTGDIRTDSKAQICPVDFLSVEGAEQYGVVITNPPFNLSIEFVENALTHVFIGGYVVVLQRLNWLGTIKRREFWRSAPLQTVYVHHKRASFYPDKPNKKDSIEYAHFVFKKGYSPNSAKLKVI
ncbi:SAM-dependent methyltransferase [Pseudoalteromonas sp. CnMc7-15]|uniref:SAM-dependent methyltransferase n=1 Tax=unclassified Pseudoalteromonas TaxID=194690 RepID=UPI001EF69F51|nr:SAM-dependent methyltransferase [Pseudoalteromonas sp. CnMc7-15]MCG7567093.1 SAM-dependent methyltransferase [Pseudoalteromonas sp. CnMc7-15]